MVSQVTIQGSGHQTIVLNYDATANFALAQQIAAQINAQIASGSLVTEFDANGPPPKLPSSVSGAFVQTTEGQFTLPVGYTTDLVTKPGNAVVFGSGAANQLILSGASTSLTFSAASGSGTVVAGGGNNRISVSGTSSVQGSGGNNGSWDNHTGNKFQRNAGGDPHAMGYSPFWNHAPNIQDGTGNPANRQHDPNGHGYGFDGNDGNGDKDGNGNQNGGRNSTAGSGWTIYTGSGNDVISALGSVNATIGAGGGSNAITLGNGQDLVISTGDDSIMAGSGQATINATGATADLVQGQAGNLLFIGGAGGATIFGGTGSDTYSGSTAAHVGNQLIEGGSAGGNDLFAGNGLATLVGGGNNDQLFSYGSSAQLLVAGSGNETLSAAFSNGNDTLTAGSGQTQMIGGNGADTFVGGSGQSTITGASGKSLFVFVNDQSGGTELIQGFVNSTSIHIDLQGYAANEINKALASQTVSHGSVSIALTDGTKITFQDVASLSKSNFT